MESMDQVAFETPGRRSHLYAPARLRLKLIRGGDSAAFHDTSETSES